jgi:hypothetical protein
MISTGEEPVSRDEHDFRIAVAEAAIMQNVPEPLDQEERDRLVAYILDVGVAAFVHSRREKE